jgi:hypothetical protein
MISVPLSTGDLLDRVSILRIKRQEMGLDSLDIELGTLEDILEREGLDPQASKNLERVNQLLWNSEERVRRLEKELLTEGTVIRRLNDWRVRLKRDINRHYEEKDTEHKSYM